MEGGADSVETVRRIYGFNWASVEGRRAGLEELSSVISPEFESRFSPELGRRVAKGVAQLAVFGDALEQDFSDFRYEPQEFEPAPSGQVVVSGRIVCQARASGMPLEGEFSHVWTLQDGQAALVEAFRHRDEARAAAGL